MKKNKIKIISILLIILSVMSIGISSYAHSGRTDSSGGHRDNKNKSGLGSYHYHCGGNPAHLHTNGVCPYSSTSSTNNKSNTNSSSSSKKTTTTTTTTPSTIAVTGIQINENIENIEVGKSQIITAGITPSNATDKSVIWRSSDESIATISQTGEIVGRQSGIVDITATSSNGKTSTIKVNIKEENKPANIITSNVISKGKNDISNNITYNQEDSNPLGGIMIAGLLSGGGYIGYRKLKK